MTAWGETSKFYYSGDKVIYTTNGSNNIIAEFTYDSYGNPATMTYNGVTYYYHIDGHGNVTAMTDAAGNTVAQYNYDAWGKILSQSGSMAAINPFRYAGYRYDEATGLYYLMARYYDPGVGRFISRDTFHGFEEEPQSLNQYSYCHNNPVMYVDPSGHWVDIISVKWAAAIFNTLISAAIGGVGAGAIKLYLKRVGKDAAARIFTKTIVSKLTAWGAVKLAVGISFAVNTFINYLDIGTALAKWIDARDAKPHNNYITI